MNIQNNLQKSLFVLFFCTLTSLSAQHVEQSGFLEKKGDLKLNLLYSTDYYSYSNKFIYENSGIHVSAAYSPIRNLGFKIGFSKHLYLQKEEIFKSFQYRIYSLALGGYLPIQLPGDRSSLIIDNYFGFNYSRFTSEINNSRHFQVWNGAAINWKVLVNKKKDIYFIGTAGGRIEYIKYHYPVADYGGFNLYGGFLLRSELRHKWISIHVSQTFFTYYGINNLAGITIHLGEIRKLKKKSIEE